MAAEKKKRRIQASEIDVGKRTLESVLIDLAEQIKANDARFADRTARAEERSTRAEEHAMIALQTIASVTQDLRAFTHEMRVLNARTDSRLTALESART
jgi:hypothetical protein